MSKKLEPIDPAIRERAHQLYMAHTPFNDISSQLKVSTSTLAQWRTRDGWLEEREAADDQLKHDIVSARKLDLQRIAKNGIAQIERTIKFIQDRPDAMSVMEAEKLANLISVLDRVARLDNKEATENVALKVGGEVSLNVERIREVILQDAFLSPPATETSTE